MTRNIQRGLLDLTAVFLILLPHAPAQGLTGVETIAVTYGIGLGVTLVAGPQAGTQDHYNYILPNGREFAVDIKSRTWLSETKYASGFVHIEAAKKILPLMSFHDTLEYRDPETGEKYAFLIVLDANPDQVLQQIGELQDALEFKNLMKAKQWERFPLQVRAEVLASVLKDAQEAKSEVDSLKTAIDAGKDKGFPEGFEALASTFVAAREKRDAAKKAVDDAKKALDDATKVGAAPTPGKPVETLREELTKAQGELTKAEEQVQAAWKTIDEWFAQKLKVVDEAIATLSKADVEAAAATSDTGQKGSDATGKQPGEQKPANPPAGQPASNAPDGKTPKPEGNAASGSGPVNANGKS
jgi:hypothetical protein